MDKTMKSGIISLAATLALSLVASVALAQKTDPALKYAPSLEGITPKSGVIKSLRDCPVGTDAFFKNVSPFISGGPGGNPGEYLWEGVFPVDGSEVTLNVYWSDDNSYRYEAFGGVVWAIGPEIDSDKLIYESDSPLFADGGHNVLKSGGDSAAVNHLDVCLSLVDTTPPFIEFIEPLDGDTVSGTVTVIVTATDPSGVDPNSVTVSVNGGTPVSMTCTQEADDQYRCTYDWRTTEPGEELPAGTYTITVEAKDGAVPVQNTATVTITVDLVNSLSSCFGILGDEDFTGELLPDGFANGCKPTVLANVQVPPDTNACNPDLQPAGYIIPAYCNISGKQLKPDPSKYAPAAAKYGNGRCDACALDYCGDITAGEYGIPDPRMYCDGVFDSGTRTCSGDWIPVEPLVPLLVKDVAEGDPELVLGKYVYGYNGCFAASQHFRGGALVDLYTYWPADPPTGLVFIKTHRPADVIPPGLVVACNDGEADAAQAGYQPIGKNQSVDRLEDGTPAITLAATQKCVNPPRTLSRDNGIDVSNIIETDGSDDPLAFKYQMAQMQFDALYAALDCAEPTFLRGRIKFSDVTSPINQAQAQFGNGSIAALERARDDLQDAALAIRTGNWDVTAENCAGDALARTENLAWRMTDLIAALTAP